MRSGYELFDHTADVGVRLWAPTPEELIGPATQGLYAAIGRVITRDDPRERTFTQAGSDRAYLLRDYLAELLHLFETERYAAADVDVVEFSPQRLVVRATLQPVDLDRSDLEREVKAVTYHELDVRKTSAGYEGVYIVDI